MTTPPSDDSVSKLFLTDTFYSWFIRTNEIVDKINPITVYGISADTDTGYQGITIENLGEGFHKVGYALPHIVNEDLGTTHVFQNWVNFNGGISGAVINTINGKTGDVYVVQTVSGQTSDLVTGNVEHVVLSVNGFTGTTAGVVTIPGLITSAVAGQKGRILVVNEGGTFDTINFVNDWPADGDDTDQASTVLQKAFRVNTGTAAAGILVSGGLAGAEGIVNPDYNTISNEYYGYPDSKGTIINIPSDTNYNHDRISLHTGSAWTVAPDIHMPGNSLIAAGGHLSIRAATRSHTKSWEETEDGNNLGTPREINIIPDPRLKYSPSWGEMEAGNLDKQGSIVCQFSRTSVRIGLADYLNNRDYSHTDIKGYNVNAGGQSEDPRGAPLVVFAGPQSQAEYDGSNMPTMILMHARQHAAGTDNKSIGCMKFWARDDRTMSTAQGIEAVGEHGIVFSVGKPTDPGNMSQWKPRIVSAFRDDGSFEMGYIADHDGRMSFRREGNAQTNGVYAWSTGRLFTRIIGAKGAGADYTIKDVNNGNEISTPWHAGHIQTQGGFENYFFKSDLVEDYGSAPINYFKLDTTFEAITVTHKNTVETYTDVSDAEYFSIKPSEVSIGTQTDFVLEAKVKAPTVDSDTPSYPRGGQILIARDDEGHMRWEDKAFSVTLPLDNYGTLSEMMDVRFGSPWSMVYWASFRGSAGGALNWVGGGKNSNRLHYVLARRYWVSSGRNMGECFKWFNQDGPSSTSRAYLKLRTDSDGDPIVGQYGNSALYNIQHPQKDLILENNLFEAGYPSVSEVQPYLLNKNWLADGWKARYLNYDGLGNNADENGSKSAAGRIGGDWGSNGVHGSSGAGGYQYSNIIYQSIKAASEDQRYIYDDWIRFKDQYDKRVAHNSYEPGDNVPSGVSGLSAGTLTDVFNYHANIVGSLEDNVGTILSDEMIRIYACGGYAGFGLPRPTGIQSWAHGEGGTAGCGWNRPAYVEGMHGLHSAYRVNNGILWGQHYVEGGWGLSKYGHWVTPADYGDMIPTHYDDHAARAVGGGLDTVEGNAINWATEWNRTFNNKHGSSTKGNIFNFFDNYTNGTGGFEDPHMPGSDARGCAHNVEAGFRQSTSPYIYKLDYFKLFSNFVEPEDVGNNGYWKGYKTFMPDGSRPNSTTGRGPYYEKANTYAQSTGSVAQQFHLDRGYSTVNNPGDHAEDWNNMVVLSTPYGVGSNNNTAEFGNHGELNTGDRVHHKPYRAQTGVCFENPYDTIGTLYNPRAQNLGAAAPPADGSKYTCNLRLNYTVPPGMRIKLWVKPVLMPEVDKLMEPDTWHYGSGPRMAETVGGDERICDTIAFTLGMASHARDKRGEGVGEANPFAYHGNSIDAPGGSNKKWRKFYSSGVGSGTHVFGDGRIMAYDANGNEVGRDFAPKGSHWIHYSYVNNPLCIRASSHLLYWQLLESVCFDGTRDRLMSGTPSVDVHEGKVWAARYNDQCPTPYNREQNNVPWMPLWDGSRSSLIASGSGSAGWADANMKQVGGYVKFSPDNNSSWGGTISFTECLNSGYYCGGNDTILKFDNSGNHPHYAQNGLPCTEVPNAYGSNISEWGPTSSGDVHGEPYWEVYDDDDDRTKDYQGDDLLVDGVVTTNPRPLGSIKYIKSRNYNTVNDDISAGFEGSRYGGTMVWSHYHYSIGRIHANMSTSPLPVQTMQGGEYSMGYPSLLWAAEAVEDAAAEGVNIADGWIHGSGIRGIQWVYKSSTREQPFTEIILDSSHIINGNPESGDDVSIPISINVPIYANGNKFKLVAFIADVDVNQDYMFRKGTFNFKEGEDPIFKCRAHRAWFENDEIILRDPDCYSRGHSRDRTSNSTKTVFNDIKWQSNKWTIKDACVGQDESEVLNQTVSNPCWWGGHVPGYYSAVIPDPNEADPGWFIPNVVNEAVLRGTASEITLSR